MHSASDAPFPSNSYYPPDVVMYVQIRYSVLYRRTTTSTHGIRICFFSKSPLTSSKPLPLAVAFTAPYPILCLTPSMATLASAPPVPLIAVIAMPAVSIRVSVSVALPLKYDDAVSEGTIAPLGHRGANQSALKSNSEKTRTKRRIEQ